MEGGGGFRDASNEHSTLITLITWPCDQSKTAFDRILLSVTWAHVHVHFVIYRFGMSPLRARGQYRAVLIQSTLRFLCCAISVSLVNLDRHGELSSRRKNGFRVKTVVVAV